MGSRNNEKPIAELIREIVRHEMRRGLISAHGISSDGDLTFTATRNINLNPIGTGKIYANGVELGFGRTGNKIWLDADHTCWIEVVDINGDRVVQIHSSGGVSSEPV